MHDQNLHLDLIGDDFRGRRDCESRGNPSAGGLEGPGREGGERTPGQETSSTMTKFVGVGEQDRRQR